MRPLEHSGLVAEVNYTSISPPTLPRAVLDAMKARGELVSLPDVTIRLLELIADPQATAREIQEVMRIDPALTTRILRVVNSAFFGLLHRVSSLDHAVVMLGPRAVKNIALGASLYQFATLAEPGHVELARSIWRHSLAVAVAVRVLAPRKAMNADEPFVAGLLHDLGLIVSTRLFPEKVREIISRSQARGGEFCAAEREVLGVDHQAIGAHMAAEWRFPRALLACISQHHDARRAPDDLRSILAIVQVADIEACTLRLGFAETAASAALSPELLECAGLQAEQVEAASAQLPKLVRELESVLE